MKNKYGFLLFLGMNAILMNVIPILSSFASNSNKLESKLTLHDENTGNSAFNVTLKSNDIPCNAGNYMYQSILTPLNKKNTDLHIGDKTHASEL